MESSVRLLFHCVEVDGQEKMLPFSISPGFPIFASLDPHSWLILAWSGPRKTGSCIANSCESDLYQKIDLIIYNCNSQVGRYIYVGQFASFSSHRGNQTKVRSLLLCKHKLLVRGQGLREIYLQIDLPRIPQSPFAISAPPCRNLEGQSFPTIISLLISTQWNSKQIEDLTYSVSLLLALSLWEKWITYLARPQ